MRLGPVSLEFRGGGSPERRDSLENPSIDLVQALVAITDGTTVSSVSMTAV